uniref:Uncharacterized protein n=1 Tax=Opuntia streptacantha TaxID=393608 RepID=A0A7C9D3F6_OPUST
MSTVLATFITALLMALSTTQRTTTRLEVVLHLENFGFKPLLRLIQMLHTNLVLLVIWVRHTTLFQHLSTICRVAARLSCLSEIFLMLTDTSMTLAFVGTHGVVLLSKVQLISPGSGRSEIMR